MKTRNHAVEFEQWMIQGRRFLIPDVEPGAADMAGLERGQQGLLVVDAAARRGDEQRAAFHPLQCARVDHAQGVLRARAMQGNDVGRRQQIVQRGGLGAAPADLLLGQVGVGGQHAHAKRLCQGRHARADVADADDAEDLAADFVPHEVLARETPLVPEAPVAFDDSPRQREHQAERVLGDRVGVAARLVHHRDPGHGAGGDIDGVVAGAGRRNAQQRRAACQQLRADEPAARKLVLRGGYMVDMRACQRRPTRRLGVCAQAYREIDIGLVIQPLIESRIDRQVEADHVLALAGHSRIPGIATLPVKAAAARAQLRRLYRRTPDPRYHCKSDNRQ